MWSKEPGPKVIILNGLLLATFILIKILFSLDKFDQKSMAKSDHIKRLVTVYLFWSNEDTFVLHISQMPVSCLI